MKELNVEYGELLAKKKKLFADYRDAKELMKTYQTAKYNIERLLNITEEEERGLEEKQIYFCAMGKREYLCRGKWKEVCDIQSLSQRKIEGGLWKNQKS